ncbi:MAG: aminoacyl-histidine dipeptidase [Candidatus Stygibacter australis]|nr:aminoacyl-histidine dipeptidase [Candidatus Stygibacter australis]
MGNITGKFLSIFNEIVAIPRCSKHEEAIGDWLVGWAKTNKLKFKRDEAGNIVILVPGTSGYEQSKTVILQGHMDMVCEKNPESDHNFCTDPIIPIVDGDWLRADNTTLGADNGVAIALALMLVEENKPHPPLEILFTVDEETGLKGAKELQPEFLEGKILINLDSEGEGKFTIGCAGGKHIIIRLPLEYEPAYDGSTFLHLTISGLLGGHSGVDINKNRASALKLLSRALYILQEEFSFNIAGISGGSSHNAISRNAECTICIYPEDQEKIEEKLSVIKETFLREYAEVDPAIELTSGIVTPLDEILTEESTLKAIDLLLALPHGVAAMSYNIPGLVETSCNMAVIEIESSNLRILTSIRSSVGSRVEALGARILATAELAGAKVHVSEGYPAWEPNTDSELLKKCVISYSNLFKHEPGVLIIHAGLECGLIGEKYPGMEMISFGPSIENAHSPCERLNLPSFERTWEFLAVLLEDLQ